MQFVFALVLLLIIAFLRQPRAVARGGLYAKLQIQSIRYANQFYQLFMQIWPRARRVITF